MKKKEGKKPRENAGGKGIWQTEVTITPTDAGSSHSHHHAPSVPKYKWKGYLSSSLSSCKYRFHFMYSEDYITYQFRNYSKIMLI